MYAINHITIQTLKSLGPSGISGVDEVANIGNIEEENNKLKIAFVFIPVLSTAFKEGIKPAQNEVRCAVQNVMRFLFKGKSDAVGPFKELSDCKVIQRKNGGGVPMFKVELDIFQKSRQLQCANIVSFVNMRSLRIFNKGDLNISSKDLNDCDFAMQLGTSLADTSPTIYFECDDLNKRGLKRLLDLLTDFKGLFDSRVLVILLSLSALSTEISEFSEKEFCISEPARKKAKLESDCELLDVKVKEDSFEREMLDKKRDIEIYELKKGCEDMKKGKEYYQQKYDALKEEHEISLKKDVEIEKVLRDYDNLKKENKTIVNDNKKLECEKETIVSDNKKLILEKKSFDRNNENMKSEIESIEMDSKRFRSEHESVVMDNNRLKTENEKIVKDNNQFKMTNNTFVNENDRLKTENVNFVKDNNNVVIEKDRLKTENVTIVKDNNSLKMENNSLVLENARLKTENDTLVKDNNRLKMGNIAVVKDNCGLQNENVNKDGVFQKLVDSILENRNNLKSANACEIIKKSIPKLHYSADVSNSENGSVCYSVNIKRGFVIQDYKELAFVQGYGTTKKMAKIVAFENLIENILKYNAGLRKD